MSTHNPTPGDVAAVSRKKVSRVPSAATLARRERQVESKRAAISEAASASQEKPSEPTPAPQPAPLSSAKEQKSP